MIREIVLEDLRPAVTLLKDMKDEGYCPDISFCELKVAKLLVSCINDDNRLCLVAEEEGDVVGVFVGYVDEYFFNYEEIAVEQVMFVKEEYRKKGIAAELIGGFETWSREREVKDICASATVGIDNGKVKTFYERLGYDTIGYMFKKET